MKVVLFFGVLVFGFSLKAQYTITAASIPIPGDVQSSVITYTTGLTLPTIGTNQLWNYSGLTTNLSSVSSETYVALSSVPSTSLFSGATIGLSNAPGYADVYKINSSTWDYLGSAGPTTNNCTIYSDPGTILKIPFAFGNSFSDSYALPLGNGNASGSFTTIANGTGTLILPGYTLTPVLEVYSHFVEIDYYTAASTSYTSNVITDQYFFYSSASKFPLLMIYTTTNTINPGNTVSTDFGAAINTNLVFTGIKESSLQSSFSIYPNPVATKNISIAFTIKESTSANFQLFNNLGQVVKEITSDKLSSGENKVSIKLENIPTGIYYLQIKTGEYESVKKLVIE